MNESAAVFDALLAALQSAADYNRDDVVPPAAVLWTDEKGEWGPFAPRLRGGLPHFYTLGVYDSATRTGPAIWLRRVLAGKIPEVAVGGAVPILYLPGVGRATLRATEDCPHLLKPLAELQFRGVFWSQASAKDWTLSAFLQAEKGGLGLTVAKDQATAHSIRCAAEKLGAQPKAVWEKAWNRFEAAPARYARVAELLRRAKPTPEGGLFSEAEEFWPQDNEAEQESLRKKLLELPTGSVAEARNSLLALEDKHAPRRDWVWAKLNRSPLAEAVRHLATLAGGNNDRAHRRDDGGHGYG